jgi:flagellar basal body-associated protein FliL
LWKDLSQQPPPPPPPEIKKSKRLIAVALILLLVVPIGVVFGWSIWQSQAGQAEYTRVKVLTDDYATVAFGQKLNVQTYFFYYKSMGHYDGNGIWIGQYNPQTPIAVDTFGSSDRNLASTQGSRYDILGIEVVVSEVYNDYVILLVKPL